MVPLTTSIKLQYNERRRYDFYSDRNRSKRNRVFNLDPQNVPTYNRQQLYMGIIQATEIFILELRNDDYFEKTERLQKTASKILSKDVNKKHQKNLTIRERKAIREIKK